MLGLEGQDLVGLSPAEIDQQYLRVHRHLLSLMRKTLCEAAVKCDKCHTPAFWKLEDTGPYPHTLFRCDEHKLPNSKTCNVALKKILNVLRGV